MRVLFRISTSSLFFIATLILLPTNGPADPSRDFDADDLDDVAVFDPTAARFHVRFSSRLDQPGGNTIGSLGDVPAEGDFNGDGVADQAVFNRTTGNWNVILSSGQSVTVLFGTPGEVPVPARYSGFACTDLATYNPQTAVWTIANCAIFGPQLYLQFGLPGDAPLAGDVDGDGLDDVTVVTLSEMFWRIRGTQTGLQSFQFGLPGDIPFLANIHGDERKEAVVYRPSANQFIVQNGGQPLLTFPAPRGLLGDRPVVSNVDGDRYDDLIVFHPPFATFDIDSSRLFSFFGISVADPTPSALQAPAPSIALPLGSRQFQFGAVEGDFDRDLRSEVTLLRKVNGLWQWAVHNTFGEVYFYEFGHANDRVHTGDFDGDLRVEPITVRNRGDGGIDWFIRTADGAALRLFFGFEGDETVLGDFDCDGKDDLAVARPDPISGGFQWFFLLSGTRLKDLGAVPSVAFGLATDTVFAADMNGDRCDEMVVAQEYLGGVQWYSRSLLTGEIEQTLWGLAGVDRPLHPIDFDGDGRADPAVVRIENEFQTAYLRLGTGRARVVPLGSNGQAITGYFNGLTSAEVGMYFEATDSAPARVTVHRFDGFAGDVILGASAKGDVLLPPGGQRLDSEESSEDVATVSCDKNGSFEDGRGGRLWKPASDNTGRPVILMPRNYWTRTGSIEVFGEDGVKLLEATRRVCCPNGNRAHFDVNRSPEALDEVSPLTVRFNLRDGTNECLNVPLASQRYD